MSDDLNLQKTLKIKTDDVSEEQEIHLVNYRISFDAMRAYHTSEIEHKLHAIEMLKSIITAAILTYSALIGYSFIEDKYFYPIVSIVISVSLFIVLFCAVWQIVNITIRKINGDNNRYEKYRNECLIARKYLGLTSMYDDEYDDTSLYWGKNLPKEKKPRNGQGNIKTNNILVSYGVLISVIAFLASFFSVMLVIWRM